MPELPPDFDLKLMPDWLKEPAGQNPYADYEVREDRRGPGRGREGDRRRDDRGPRPGGPGGPGRFGGERKGGGKDARGKKPPGGKRPEGPPRDRRDDRREAPRPEAPAAPPVNVGIEFFPDEHAAASIAREIKSTHRAYSLFELARMFLAKPERHWVKITSKSVAEPLFQAGENGPVSLDKAQAEKALFPAARQRFYVEESVQREAPKGNFTNVARCRANGQLLGPTNYHGYQPALRKLYEERFSRRMSFPEFQREIEVVSDPALVEQWKDQARTTTRFRLKPVEPAPEPALAPAAVQAEETPESAPLSPATETAPESAAAPASQEESPAAATPPPAGDAEPPAAAESTESPAEESAPPPAAAEEGPTFASLAEVEVHFREHYLPGMLRTASAFQIPGETSRTLADRGLAGAVRQGWEQERGFPGQMMHQLRQHFTRAGLHVFKHKKRMQFVTPIRPALMEGGSLSPSIAEILRVIQGDARCNRARLAAAILGTDESSADAARKTTLASDLRWLVDTGRVIEFSDGTLDLPLAPAKAEAAKPEPAATPKAAEPAAAPASEEPGGVSSEPTPEPAAPEPLPAEQDAAPAEPQPAVGEAAPES